MLGLASRTFRDRWYLFLGAILSLAVGVALMESSLIMVASAQFVPIPDGSPRLAAMELRAAYDDLATLMIITSMISMFLTVFIVSTTFAFTVAQRLRDLALLRLSGGSRGQIRRLLLVEALLLGVCGVAIGVLLGAPAVRAHVWLLSRIHFLPEGFTTAWTSWPAVVAAGSGFGVALLGVLTASRRAARIRPLEVLRDSDAAARVMTLPRWIAGLALMACSIVMVLFAPAVGLVVALALALGLAVAGGVALSMLSPLIVPLTGRLLGLVLRRSTIGGLAEANLRDGVRRSAATAAPLIVLVSLLLGLAGSLGSVARATAVEQRQTTVGDLVVETTGADADRVASVPGVAVASPEITVPATLEMTVTSDDSSETEVDETTLLAVDPHAYQRVHPLTPIAGSLSALTGPTVAASQNTSDGERLSLGRKVTVDLGTGRRTLRLVAVMPEQLSTSDQFLVPRDLLPDASVADAPAQVIVRVAAGMSVEAVARAIRAADIGEVTTVSAWARAQASQQQSTNNATLIVLMGLSGLYAVMAVVNAVVMAGADRGREFAVLRMSGLSRAQVVWTALVESSAVTLIGLLLGGVVVTAVLAGIASAALRTIGTAVVAVPWELATAMAAGAFAVTAVASILTTLAVTQTRPIQLASARE
jgi:putative ABC transport system permease protein